MMRDPICKNFISDDTRFFLTPAGLAALNAAPAARRPSRKRCLVIGLAAKRSRKAIHPQSIPAR